MEANDVNMYITAATVVMLMMAALKMKKRKENVKTKRVWVKKWINKRTEGRGILNMLDNELKLEDPNAYRNFLRMNSSQFEYLLSQISPIVDKKDTTMRECVSSRNKLEITLRFLATGETFRSLMYSTRIHESTISRFVPKICSAICEVLTDTYLKTPRNAEQWMSISKEFDNMWQFPHCLGALDGRHIEFRPPISTGAYYYNYKGTKSIVLLGLVDANYRFTYVNIGVNGRISDGGVFAQSGLAEAILNKSLNFPPAEVLPGQDKTTPYVIVADDAFPLSTHLMKPYPERGLSHDHRIFNYRLSRARRIVENAFGILANRFRVLLTPIGLAVEKVELVTKTCVILHNFLATTNGKSYLETGNDVNLQQMPTLGRQSGNRTNTFSREIRDNFAQFFNSPYGTVSWQEKSIGNFNY